MTELMSTLHADKIMHRLLTLGLSIVEKIPSRGGDVTVYFNEAYKIVNKIHKVNGATSGQLKELSQLEVKIGALK